MKYSAVIFDMDGLLIDSEKIALATFQDQCDRLNLGKQLPLYLKILGTNTAETKRLLSVSSDFQAVDVDSFMNDWMRHYQKITTTKAVPLMTGVQELLDHLAVQSIPMVVATSTDTELANSKLTACGIANQFKTIIGGDQINNSKPAPDIYLKAIEYLGVTADTALALEDSPNGVRAATAAGLDVIQVPDLLEPDQELRQLGHLVKADLLEVRSWLSMVC